jgi:hypothetical protein
MTMYTSVRNALVLLVICVVQFLPVLAEQPQPAQPSISVEKTVGADTHDALPVLDEKMIEQLIAQMREVNGGNNPLAALFGSADGQGEIPWQEILQGTLDIQKNKDARIEATRRRTALEALSPELREQLDKTLEAFEQASQGLRFETFIEHKVHEFLDALKDAQAYLEKELYDDLVTAVKRLLEASTDGSLGVFLGSGNQGGPLDLGKMLNILAPNQNSKRDPRKVYNAQELSKLYEALLTAHAALQLDSHSDVAQDVATMLHIVKMIGLHLHKELANLTVDYAKPIIEYAQQSMRDALKQFLAVHRAIDPVSPDIVLQDAVDYWIVQLNKYRDTLTAIKRLAFCSNLNLAPIMFAIGHVQDILAPWFGANSLAIKGGQLQVRSLINDLPTYSNVIDASLKAGVLGCMMGQGLSDLASQGLQQHVFNGRTLQAFANPLDETEYLVYFLSTQGPNFLNAYIKGSAYGPSSFNFYQRTALRIAASLSWFYIQETWRTFLLDENHAFVIRPSKDMFFKMVMLYALTELQYKFDSQVQRAIRKTVGDRRLEKCELYTMGLLRPALVTEVLEITKIITLAQRFAFVDAIIELDARDIIMFDSSRALSYLPAMIPGGLAPDARQIAVNNVIADNINNVVVYRLLVYALRNVGEFWGNYASRKMHKGTDVIIDGIGKVFGKIGVLFDRCFTDDEDWQEPAQTPNAFDSLYTIIDQVKMLLKMFFEPSMAIGDVTMPNQTRFQGISLLRGQGIVTEEEVANDTHNPTVVNDKIIEFVLEKCAVYRIISYEKADRLWEFYAEDKTDTDALIDKLWRAVIKGTKGLAGGKVIGWLASWGAVGLVNEGIPLWPGFLNPCGGTTLRIPPIPKNINLFHVSEKLYKRPPVPPSPSAGAPSAGSLALVPVVSAAS